MHGEREDRHQSSLVLKDLDDQLCLGNICGMFQRCLGDTGLNGSLFVFV